MTKKDLIFYIVNKHCNDCDFENLKELTKELCKYLMIKPSAFPKNTRKNKLRSKE